MLFFPVCLLLGALLTQSSVAGLVIGVAATAALGGVLVVKYRRMVAGTVVRFSPQGVEMSDAYGYRLRLSWPRIERVDVVRSRMASPRTIGRPGGLRVRAGAMQSVGLVGWGERDVPARMPRWMRDHLARVPVDPETGLQWLAIPLGAVDPLWERGPMGDWVRRHRPDLLA
ncbi:hypothetical protein ABT294_23930 [Nonomuraea sp. NPDC000554]|uniref:hypothetical protein n=1 Tax=Nonomuraea sp. NPDC000554 TaxID=3154259 RepID=UPI0033249B8A